VNLVSALTPNMAWRGHALLKLEPLAAMRVSHALAIPVAWLLLVAGVYLGRRRRRALQLAIVLLVVLAALNILKGLDVEEAAADRAPPPARCCDARHGGRSRAPTWLRHARLLQAASGQALLLLSRPLSLRRLPDRKRRAARLRGSRRSGRRAAGPPARAQRLRRAAGTQDRRARRERAVASAVRAARAAVAVHRRRSHRRHEH